MLLLSVERYFNFNISYFPDCKKQFLFFIENVESMEKHSKFDI